ncbi:MAG: HlyC/CorC family transporter [Bacteroidales bacterium]|nr:HlyC/CorC family transporter [Bacteroidales bacterium]MBP5214665.1 HlyC/CorC family transporter [Bacteroidales bacterium]MBP5764477.1 HlyC/CorC family transporter [Bacteroidales bacterium]
MSLYFSILVTLLFSAFFSGMEMAFISANRVRLELDKQNGGLMAKALIYFYGHSEKFISTMLVGNNIALIVYGIFMADLLESPIRHWLTQNDFLVVLIQTVLSTLLILFTAEYLPKALFKLNPNAMMRAFAVPLYLIYWLLYPISSFATMLSHTILRLAGLPVQKEKPEVLTKVDLDHFIQQGLDRNEENEEHRHDEDENNDSQELQMFQNALDFSNVQVRDCMIPRSELTVVSVDTPFAKLNRLFVETGYSKIPVFKDDIDNLVGYIHSSEMFRKPRNWQQKIIPIPFVPETIAAPKVLRMLMEQKKSIAAVVDEFGGTAGIVTTEDLFEEIIGDIEDEHDRLQLVERKISDKEYELSGRLEISKINEDFDLRLPESDDYLTLAGLVLHELQSVPHEGDIATLEEPKIQMTIQKASATKIELIRLTILD